MKKLFRIGGYAGFVAIGLLIEKTFTVAKSSDPFIWVMIVLSTVAMIYQEKEYR
jgi:hypothetical protein